MRVNQVLPFFEVYQLRECPALTTTELRTSSTCCGTALRGVILFSLIVSLLSLSRLIGGQLGGQLVVAGELSPLFALLAEIKGAIRSADDTLPLVGIAIVLVRYFYTQDC